jgi:hypothetical protein
VRRRWTWIAWSLLAVFVLSMVVTTILSVANGNFQQEPAGFLAQLAGYSAFMVVGALIVAHRPDNAIGWIFTAIGLLAATWAPAGEYITYLYWTRSGSLPDAILVAWALLGGTWYLTVALALVFAPLLFRPVGWCRLAGGRSPGWPEPRRRPSWCWRPQAGSGPGSGSRHRQPDRGRLSGRSRA